MKCANCSDEAYFERDEDEKRKYVFFGYCADCWKNLEPGERAVLKGEEPPVKEIIHEHHWETPPLPSTKIEVVERILPPREIWPTIPTWRKIASGIWHVLATGGLLWLLWRTR